MTPLMLSFGVEQGYTQADDAQKLVQLKRSTEGGLNTGYVLIIGNKIEEIPQNDLANNCILPEGLPENFNSMNMLLGSIPRDAEHDSELWTTVDPNKTNVRKKGRYKLIKV